MDRTRAIVLVALIGALGMAWYLAYDASRRGREKPVANNELPGAKRLPTDAGSAPAGEPRREATCRTTPSGGQVSMSHEDCAFIASQIPVLASNTEPEIHSTTSVPSPRFQPGADIPSDVRDLKPLPDSVTTRLPALRGDQYFLAGQDIVVVGEGAKIAF